MFGQIVTWLGVAVVVGIIFVQAKKLGGTSGGVQTGQIIQAGGTGLSQIISSLETGGAPTATATYV